jgi:hypothetical protein
MTFEDLKFKAHSVYGRFSAYMYFGNYTLSVQCGMGTYCIPRLTALESPDEYIGFEVGIWQELETGKREYTRTWVTNQFIDIAADDDVAGYLSKEDVNNIMIKLEEAIK